MSRKVTKPCCGNCNPNWKKYDNDGDLYCMLNQKKISPRGICNLHPARRTGTVDSFIYPQNKKKRMGDVWDRMK